MIKQTNTLISYSSSSVLIWSRVLMMKASATYGSSSSPLLFPPWWTGSVGAGLFNVANLLKYVEIWVDVSHSFLVNTFVPSAVPMDPFHGAASSAVALFLLPSPWRRLSRKNWRTLLVKSFFCFVMFVLKVRFSLFYCFSLSFLECCIEKILFYFSLSQTHG